MNGNADEKIIETPAFDPLFQTEKIAFDGDKMVGFVLSVPGFKGEKRFFYSHMTAVAADFQSLGIGAKLKWAQREILKGNFRYVFFISFFISFFYIFYFILFFTILYLIF